MSITQHDWYGPGVHAYACNAIDGVHICMRGRIENTRFTHNPGQHRCACKHRWTDNMKCGSND